MSTNSIDYTMSDGFDLDLLIESTRRSMTLINDNVGITTTGFMLPEYVALRDKYYSTPRVTRWLHWRKRLQLRKLLLRQQMVFMNAVLETTDR